jgi:hypothetical protein
MSKVAAVDVAVRQQLAADAKNLTYNDAIDGASGYADADAILRFLLGVSNRLRLDSPPLNFHWSGTDAASLAGKTVLLVISIIEQQAKSPDDKTQ